jgi:hypothetical protein
VVAQTYSGRTRFSPTQEHFRTLQAARKWHTHISTWMENNGYEAINSEKTIFMKRKGAKYIIHGLFVDDMMHI